MATASADILAGPLNKAAHFERYFFTGMGASMLAVALVGFVPSLILTSERRAPVSPLVALHGLLFFAWLVIFLIQSRLIIAKRISMHRRLGMAAGFVLVLMVSLSFAATVAMVRRGFDLSGDLMRTVPPKIGPDVLWESVFQFGDLLFFTTLAAAAILYRRRAEVHKRLMLFANVALMGAPLAHFAGHTPKLLPFIVPIIQVPMGAFLMAAFLRDFWLVRKLRPLTVSLSIAIFFFGPLCANVIGPSAEWHRVAAWLAR